MTKELWLLKSYGEYYAAQYRREAWKKTKYPSGYTYEEIMAFKEGYREKNGYFIWRGQWQDGSRMVDGFHAFEISSYEPWNSDIRYFLKEGHNLADAIRIQDQLWMENFRTMLAALASFYASTPSAGVRPKLPTPRNLKTKTPTQIPQKSVDRAIKAVESAQQLGAQAFSAYNEVKAAIEHATRTEIDGDIAKSINRDVQQFTDFIEDLSNDNLKEQAAKRK